MFEIITLLLLGGIVGYYIGVMYVSWQLRDIIYKEAKAKGLLTKDEEENYLALQKSEVSYLQKDPRVLQLRIEKENDILYLYDIEQDNFVCQATDIDQLASFALKYKNIKYATVINGKEVYAFINGEVKLAKEIL